MRPDSHLAMRATLAFGPGHCPPDLFEGSAAAVIRGLRAHANTISHARHVALEETFPKLREMIGGGAFHQAAERHLGQVDVLGRSLDELGRGIEAQLAGAAARDMARLEYAWLEAYHAPDAEPLTPAYIAGFGAEVLVTLSTARHPAARVIRHEADDGLSLISRPVADVLVAAIDRAAADILDTLTHPRPLGALLEGAEPAAVLALITAGALIAEGVPP